MRLLPLSSCTASLPTAAPAPISLLANPRRRQLVVSAGLLPTLAWAQAEPGVSARQLLIGQSLSLQGGTNDYGVAVQEGVATCLQTVNAEGGVHGRQIVLRVRDDELNSTRAEHNARTLVEQDSVFLLFGSLEGGPCTGVMKAATELKVPFFGPMAGSPSLRRPLQPLVFPVRAEHRDEFRALLGYAQKTGGSRVAFVRAASDVGRQHLDNVRQLCAELGMYLVLDLPFDPDISDAQLQDMARRLDAATPHVVINHGSPGVYGRLIRHTRQQGGRVIFSGVNAGSSQLVRQLGPLAHGMVFSQVVPSPWERKTAATREYQEAFGRLHPGREFSYGSLEGYLTAKALVAALRLAGPHPSREGFVQALHKAGGVDVAGMHARYTAQEHTGLRLVDLAIVTREGTFRH